MNTLSNTKIKESDVDWKGLDVLGIRRDELEQNGDLEQLLDGEEVNVISLNLNLFGVDITMDAYIRIIEHDGELKLQITGISPEGMED